MRTGGERLETRSRGDKLVGAPIDRVEDSELVTGNAEYTDDISVDGGMHAAVLRSQRAHANIEAISVEKAENAEGVVGVYTAADLLHGESSIQSNRVPAFVPPEADVPTDLFRRVLASDRVRYQGEPLAVVVANNRYDAHDALERIDVEYENLEAVVDSTDAGGENAPALHDSIPSNTVFDREFGNEKRTSEAFENAAYRTLVEIDEPRVVPNPIEPRAIVAEYTPGDGLCIRISTQNPHEDREVLSEVLELPENSIRVITPEVGGGFGGKIPLYPAEIAVAWCALHLERPIKWQATRLECFQNDAHGRGITITGEMAVTDSGEILGLRAEGIADLGAYLSTHEFKNPTSALWTMLSGQYEIPTIHYRVRGVVTNKSPVDAYRGVTAVTATTLIERLVHLSARKTGVDPVEFRRKNLITEFPFEASTGLRYDSGNYERALSKATDAADYREVRAHQRQSDGTDRLLGIGISSFVESTGYGPGNITKSAGRDEHWESSRIVVHKSGDVSVYCGTSDHGQGHRTTFAQLVADELGIPLEDITVADDDTERIASGSGTYASRSAVVGGSSVIESCRKIMAKAEKIAAHHLEIPEEDVRVSDGEFHVRGNPQDSISIQAIAEEAYRGWNLPENVEPGLEAVSYYRPPSDGLPISFGTHVAVVGVDPDTGSIEFERYVAVDDCGTQINPEIVEGQIHGGVAQGIGQALYERAIYDDNGNLQTSTFTDYAVPKSFQIPSIETERMETPTPYNELGIKGIGEGGTIAAPAAVVNAVVDALSSEDVAHIDMPITPEKIWRAIDEPGDS